MSTIITKPRAVAPYQIGFERNTVGTSLAETINHHIDKLELPSFENARKVLDTLAPAHLQEAYQIKLIGAPERS